MNIKVCIMHCPPDISIDLVVILRKLDTQVTLFKNYEYELDYFLRHKDFDIVIVDANYIHNCHDGLYLSNRLKIIQRKVFIIFISETYDISLLMNIINTEPFAFIPYDKIRKELPDIISRAANIIKKENKIFSYHKQNEIKSISLKNVLYFTSIHRVIKYYCIDEYTDVFYEKMDNLETTICGLTDCFIRINQSYLINMNYVLEFDNNSVTMLNDDIIMISRKYHDNLAVIKQYKRAGD